MPTPDMYGAGIERALRPLEQKAAEMQMNLRALQSTSDISEEQKKEYEMLTETVVKGCADLKEAHQEAQEFIACLKDWMKKDQAAADAEDFETEIELAKGMLAMLQQKVNRDKKN